MYLSVAEVAEWKRLDKMLRVCKEFGFLIVLSPSYMLDTCSIIMVYIRTFQNNTRF